jgi:cold shock protein
VKLFDATKGYGFIVPDDGGKDMFVHVTAVQKAGYTNLVAGARVSYELSLTGKVTRPPRALRSGNKTKSAELVRWISQRRNPLHPPIASCCRWRVTLSLTRPTGLMRTDIRRQNPASLDVPRVSSLFGGGPIMNPVTFVTPAIRRLSAKLSHDQQRALGRERYRVPAR